MPLLTQGDIVFAPFPYEDDKSISKQRPCLVLAIDSDNGRFLAAKITTTPLNRVWAVPLKAGCESLKDGDLRLDSWINLNRREWINISDFIFKIGTIHDDIFDFITKMMTSTANSTNN